MANKVFLNGEIVAIDKAGVSVTDTGFLYGTGLFETMRSYDGVVFALEDHLERLYTSAKILSIPITYGHDELKDAVYAAMEANGLKDARIRLTVTPGGSMQDPEKFKSTALVVATEFVSYPTDYYSDGVMVVLSAFRQNPYEPTTGHKTLNYFSRMLALQQAHGKDGAEAIWFTTEGRLAEGCVSNVFLVKNGKLRTPLLSTPVLSGVVRKYVLGLATENGIEFEEKDLGIDDVLGADEIFLTNSIMEILPVTFVERHLVGDGKVGKVTKQMTELFKKLVSQKTSSSD